MMTSTRLLVLLVCLAPSAFAENRAYFGDLHVHTSYSFDAFLFGTRSTPDDAYRFAKGEAIDHPGGFELQLDKPLDFYAVTDHAFFLGMWSALNNPKHPRNDDEAARRFLDASTPGQRGWAFRNAYQYLVGNPDPKGERTAWQDIVDAAQRHNDPGRFTTFVGYEYTSSVQQGNLHRNVIYRGQKVPDMPFSRLDSLNPEDLWTWMDAHRQNGIESLAIPHNSNGSDGRMFQLHKFDGSAINADYAEQRLRNEPLVEVTQVKGNSDTHPFLSPNDEWADFEIFPYRIASRLKSRPRGSYVREAYLNGLALEEEVSANPYLFGVIGSSDTHNGGERFDESKYVDKIGMLGYTPELRGSIPLTRLDGMPAYRETSGRFFGASGLAGVWADENTREAIYDAFRRKETFATTGPRIKVRFFAGYDLDESILETGDFSTAYAKGTPMGGELRYERRATPDFLVWAAQDPAGTTLQRIQVVKGWIESGDTHERVYDVACSDDLEVDPLTRRCPDNGATVRLQDCSITKGVGSAELKTFWRDPDFDPQQRAFYYVRALENPTCRWSTWDAVRAGTAPRTDLKWIIQERAYTSPIWYQPR